jgi:hypothetical protein
MFCSSLTIISLTVGMGTIDGVSITQSEGDLEVPSELVHSFDGEYWAPPSGKWHVMVPEVPGTGGKDAGPGKLCRKNKQPRHNLQHRNSMCTEPDNGMDPKNKHPFSSPLASALGQALEMTT